MRIVGENNNNLNVWNLIKLNKSHIFHEKITNRKLEKFNKLKFSCFRASSVRYFILLLRFSALSEMDSLSTYSQRREIPQEKSYKFRLKHSGGPIKFRSLLDLDVFWTESSRWYTRSSSGDSWLYVLSEFTNSSAKPSSWSHMGFGPVCL